MLQSNILISDKQTIAAQKFSSPILTWVVSSLFAIPFFWYQRSLPVPSFYGEWAAIFLGLIAVFIWLIRQKNSFLIPSLAFVPIALAILIGMQLIIVPDVFSGHARLGMVYLLFSAAIMTAMFNAKPLISIETLAAVLLLGALLNCGHDWYLVVFDEAKVLGALGQKNNYADYLMLGVVSLCYLRAQKRFGLTVFLLLLMPLIITSASLAQRSIWIYFIGLTIFTLTKAYLSKSKDELLSRSILIATTLFVLTTIALPLISPDQSSLDRLMNSGETELGAASRLWIWKSAWHMALEHPSLGVGFGNFDSAFFVTKADYASGAYWGRVENAHNIILHLFAEMGALAPLAVLLGLLVWLIAQRRQPFDSNNWWLWSCIGVVGMHSLLEYPLWYAYFLAPFAVLLGLTAQSSAEVRLPNSFRWLVCLIIGVAGLASTNLLSHYLRLESFIIRLTNDERNINAKELDTIAQEEPILRPYAWTVKASLAQITTANAREWLPFLRQVNHFAPYPDFVLKQLIAARYSGNTLEAVELAKALTYAYPKQAVEYLGNANILYQIGSDIAETMRNVLPKH